MAKSKFTPKKIILYVGIGILALYLLRRMKTKNLQTNTNTSTSTSTGTGTSFGVTPFQITNSNCLIVDNKPVVAFLTLNLDKVLKREEPMQTGNEVIWLQKWLFRNGACIEINGKFDDYTKAALLQLTGESALTIRDIEQIENSSITRTNKFYGQSI